jgi:hypothetical protein
MPEQYTILGDKVYVYKRPNSSFWQCSTYFAGKNRRISTKEMSLAVAKEIAEDWYLASAEESVTEKLRPKRPFVKPQNDTCASTTL